jgi:hypothetical protein
VIRDEQVYIDPSEPEKAGLSAVEFAHRDLLNQVLDDDGRSKSSTVSISSWHFPEEGSVAPTVLHVFAIVSNPTLFVSCEQGFKNKRRCFEEMDCKCHGHE